MFDQKKLKDNYIRYTIGHVVNSSSGKPKLANKNYKKGISLFNKIKKEPDFAEEFLLDMIKNDNISVRYFSACMLLALGRSQDIALDTLEKIGNSNETTIPLLKFNADMVLKVYKEDGKLTL